MRPRLIALAALVAVAALAAVNAQTLSGTVVSRGVPLADVAVTAEADGRRLASVTTDAQGRFAIDVATSKARDFLLEFSRAGFRRDVKVLDRSTLSRPLQVVLLPASGPGAISPEDEQKLKALVTPAGTGPLMFVPYSLPAGTDAATASALNERLRLQLQRLIITHVQAPSVVADSRGVSLTPLPVAANNDLERLRAVGEFVNALAVVSGIGIDDAATPTIELASSYVIIPRGDLFEPPVLNIVDTVPAQQIGRVALDQKMSRMWGRATVLALAARDLREAKSLPVAARKIELARVKRYLVAERADVGARDELGEAKLKELIDVVSRELGR